MVTLYLNSWEGTLLTAAPTLPETVTVQNPQFKRGDDPATQFIEVPPREETIALAEGPSIMAVRQALEAIEDIARTTPWQPRSFVITIGSTP